MSHFLAIKLSEYIGKHNKLTEGEKNIYRYCIEKIISKTIYILIILITGILLNQFFLAIVFMTTIVSLRTFGGGIHASSRILCGLISYSVGVIPMLLIDWLENMISPVIFIYMYLICIVFSVFIAPVDTRNKRFSPKQKKKLKKKFLIFVCIMSISFFIFIRFKLIPYYALISIGVLVCSISFLLGYIQNKIGETK